jgi:hypothetical protein
MVAFRRRHARQNWDHDLAAAIPQRPPRAQVVYECPACETRLLGEQRCPDCNLFCRRLGAGGACMHCGDLLTVEELLAGGGT